MEKNTEMVTPWYTMLYYALISAFTSSAVGITLSAPLRVVTIDAAALAIYDAVLMNQKSSLHQKKAFTLLHIRCVLMSIL